jgi:hypothetical protein
MNPANPWRNELPPFKNLMSKTKSDFTIIWVDRAKKVVLIEDLYSTYKRMTVTNDAEAVVETLNQIYPHFHIVYRDSEGQWGELVHENGVFKDFKTLMALSIDAETGKLG